MYQMTPPMPPAQQEPPQEKKRMSVPQIMLIVATLAFAVWYLVTAMAPEPERYATITADTIGSRYRGECLIVRDEVPYDAEGVSSVDYVAEEGTTVYRGTTICNVYSSGFSTRELATLQEYRDQIKEYQMKLLKSEIYTDSWMEKLESEVMTRAREEREIIAGARGNMSNQEKLLKAAIQARQMYLKDKYSKDQRMIRLYDDEQSQLQRISSWTKQYVAVQDSAVVSFYSDGYEYGLKPSNYEEFTPAEVRAMINGKKPDAGVSHKGKTTIYRTVDEKRWFVLMLIQDRTWNPVEGEMYDLRLENFKDTTVRAMVSSFTRTGGELLVRLMVDVPDHDITPVLYVRTCTGILGDSVSSLSVPARAIYTQDNMPGVVVVDGNYEWFIPVNILDNRNGRVFIAAIQQGVLFEGQTVRLF